MKNTRPLLLILISLIIGAIAVSLAVKWLGQRSQTPSMKVVVASQDLPLGTPLHEGMLQVVDWPASSAIKDSVEDPRRLLLRVVITPIMKGEPILAAKLAAPGEKGGLSALLHDGTRAVTVKVNEIVGVAGFALPGNYVDVMVHASDRNERPVSKIVLERILVLALAQDASTSETKPRVVNAVTLEVTPQQAEKIDLARSVGSLSLILRSQVDLTQVKTSGVRMDDLFQKQDLLVQPNNQTPIRSIAKVLPTTLPVADNKLEVIRGLQKTLE